MDYLRLSNLSKNETTIEIVKQFVIDAKENDHRIKLIALVSSKDHMNRYQLKVEIDIDIDEKLYGVYSFGRVTSALHCSSRQARLNAIDSKNNELKYIEENELLNQTEKDKAWLLIKKYKTNLSNILYVINCYKMGSSIKKSESNYRAQDLLYFNQKCGSGNWFIFEKL